MFMVYLCSKFDMPSSSGTVFTSTILKVKDTVHVAAIFLLYILRKYFFLNRTAQYSKILTFVCPCIVSIIVNDDQQDATILAYLFIPNKLCMFWAMSSPIIRST